MKRKIQEIEKVFELFERVIMAQEDFIWSCFTIIKKFLFYINKITHFDKSMDHIYMNMFENKINKFFDYS